MPRVSAAAGTIRSTARVTNSAKRSSPNTSGRVSRSTISQLMAQMLVAAAGGGYLVRAARAS